MANKKIIASIIIEVIGKPPEHLAKVLEDISNKINQEKGVKVQSKKINKSLPLKESKDFFTNFAEIEIQTEEFKDLFKIILFYMPAHVEIISPENISSSNNDLNEIINTLTQKLHKYDETARILQTQKSQMEKKLKELLPKDNSKEKENQSPN